jgi:hypothetical protein
VNEVWLKKKITVANLTISESWQAGQYRVQGGFFKRRAGGALLQEHL